MWTAGRKSGKTKLGSALTGYKTVTIIGSPSETTLIKCALTSLDELATTVCEISPRDVFGTVFTAARTLVMSIQGGVVTALVPGKLDDDHADDTRYNKYFFNFTAGASYGLASIQAKTLAGTLLKSYDIIVVGTPDSTSSITCTDEGATALAWAPCTIIPRRKGDVIYASKSFFKPQFVGDGEIDEISPMAGNKFECHIKCNIPSRNVTVKDQLAGSVELLTHSGGNAYYWGSKKTFEIYPKFSESTSGQATLPEVPAWDASIVGSAGVGRGVTTKERLASISCGDDTCAIVTKDGQIMIYGAPRASTLNSFGREGNERIGVVFAPGVDFQKVTLTITVAL
jgi:hypothetical protein